VLSHELIVCSCLALRYMCFGAQDQSDDEFRAGGWRIVISPMIPYDSPSCYHSSMRHFLVLFIHLATPLSRPVPDAGGRLIAKKSFTVSQSQSTSPIVSMLSGVILRSESKTQFALTR
jgi:hypothetical protein